LVVAAASLAACSGGDGDSLAKEIGDVRAEGQRLRKDNEKLQAQVDAQGRRIDGLAEDLNHVRGLAMEVKTAAAPKAGAAAAPGAAPGDAAGPDAAAGAV